VNPSHARGDTSTPLVSTPLVSTPLVSTPLVSTPLVSTPLVSTPLLEEMIGAHLERTAERLGERVIRRTARCQALESRESRRRLAAGGCVGAFDQSRGVRAGAPEENLLGPRASILNTRSAPRVLCAS
jgi:hypothetical protein